jgi:hypothetical protein
MFLLVESAAATSIGAPWLGMSLMRISTVGLIDTASLDIHRPVADDKPSEGGTCAEPARFASPPTAGTSVTVTSFVPLLE